MIYRETTRLCRSVAINEKVYGMVVKLSQKYGMSVSQFINCAIANMFQQYGINPENYFKKKNKYERVWSKNGKKEN